MSAQIYKLIKNFIGYKFILQASIKLSKKERKSMGPNHQRYPHICKFYFLELYKILTVNTREKSPHASRKLHREMNHFKIFQIILFF